MIAEQFGAELHYIQGKKNIVADIFSRIGLQPPLKSESNTEVLDKPPMRLLAEAFAYNPVDEPNNQLSVRLKRGKLAEIFVTTWASAQELPIDSFPLSYRFIAQEQQKDQALKKKVIDKIKGYTINTFHGGEKDWLLICKDNKIVVPKPLQKRIVS